MKETIKELTKLYHDKSKTFAERIEINRAIIHWEMQLERIIDNECV